MSFNIAHTFQGPFDNESTDSPEHVNGKISWYIRLVVHDKVRIGLVATPITKFCRPGGRFRITANVTCTIGTKTPIVLENADILGEGYNEVTGPWLYEEEKEGALNNVKVVQDGNISITMVISDVRITDIRIFEMRDFGLHSQADLIVNIGGKQLYCHSQVLFLNSKVFEKTIEEGFGEIKEIFIEDTVPFDEFCELLHHTYFPIETVDDCNWRILLRMASKFEVVQVLHVCQNVMKSLIEKSATDRKIDIFLFSWKFDVEPLKFECIKNIFTTEGEQSILIKANILQNTIYQEMENNRKLRMLEFLISELDLRCHIA